MKKHYTSLSEATNDLKARGYSNDFNIKPDCLECPTLHLQVNPENFTVDEFHRFEGMSSTDDNSIVFAITSDQGVKGVLVDAYGVYSSSLNDAMIKKLSIRR
ncbi:MAG TPA: phosphoribosylpyrophosphate synthetase [Cyclobacteriaceae bacterium]|nr:phosphoribosylpyrophosphate synthetase [Cyclobacteriaceae bacterium]HMX88017.1 phosphoribosylpyrophosphate synthetase [Saprospiraceae bacterium]HMX00851.1 phosphoribosylpyrophosphate synthetase [Cyclobacteriaceae bacterium]HMY93655.1 phosphoribosylpyrophosphate synthetase [Cyclobacteriaceae bacterium]HNA12911.1 phosphoribosylpyrophosphate synthetase [Cyclobacteriaceae bacterium]